MTYPVYPGPFDPIKEEGVMADIHVLKPRPAAVRENVVSTLEGLLELAKAGEIDGIAVAYVLRDRSAVTDWSATDEWPALLGAASMLNHAMLTSTSEDNES